MPVNGGGFREVVRDVDGDVLSLLKAKDRAWRCAIEANTGSREISRIDLDPEGRCDLELLHSTTSQVLAWHCSIHSCAMTRAWYAFGRSAAT